MSKLSLDTRLRFETEFRNEREGLLILRLARSWVRKDEIEAESFLLLLFIAKNRPQIKFKGNQFDFLRFFNAFFDALDAPAG